MAKKTLQRKTRHSRDIIPSQTALAVAICMLRGNQHKSSLEAISAHRIGQPELEKELLRLADDCDQVATFLDARLAELDAAREV